MFKDKAEGDIEKEANLERDSFNGFPITNLPPEEQLRQMADNNSLTNILKTARFIGLEDTVLEYIDLQKLVAETLSN